MKRDDKWFSTRPWFSAEDRTRMQAEDAAEEELRLANWEKWEAKDIAAGRELHATPEWVTRARATREGKKDWQVEARTRLLATVEPPADNWLIEARARLENAAKEFSPYIRLNGSGVARA